MEWAKKDRPNQVWTDFSEERVNSDAVRKEAVVSGNVQMPYCLLGRNRCCRKPNIKRCKVCIHLLWFTVQTSATNRDHVLF